MGQIAWSQGTSWNLEVLAPDMFIIFPVIEMVLSGVSCQERAQKLPRDTH